MITTILIIYLVCIILGVTFISCIGGLGLIDFGLSGFMTGVIVATLITGGMMLCKAFF